MASQWQVRQYQFLIPDKLDVLSANDRYALISFVAKSHNL